MLKFYQRQQVEPKDAYANKRSVISQVPIALYHRDDGYLCSRDPDPSKNCPVVAFDKHVIPPGTFYIVPKSNDDSEEANMRSDPIRTKEEYFKELQNLIGKEVALKNSDSAGKYITSRGSRTAISFKDTTSKSKYDDEIQFFQLNRTDTGAYTFRVSNREAKQQPLYMYRAHKDKEQGMQTVSGDGDRKVITVKKRRVKFSSNADSFSNANEWAIEPKLCLDSCSSSQDSQRMMQPGSLLFLGIVNLEKKDIEVSWHSGSSPCAWRSRQQWDEAIKSLCDQHSRQNNNANYSHEGYYAHADYQGTKAKWMAKCTNDGSSMCIAISSSNFHQELLEECIFSIIDMSPRPTSSDVGDVGEAAIGCQIEEHKLVEEENGMLRPTKNVQIQIVCCRTKVPWLIESQPTMKIQLCLKK
jgi:hypothetical protein